MSFLRICVCCDIVHIKMLRFFLYCNTTLLLSVCVEGIPQNGSRRGAAIGYLSSATWRWVSVHKAFTWSLMKAQPRTHFWSGTVLGASTSSISWQASALLLKYISSAIHIIWNTRPWSFKCKSRSFLFTLFQIIFIYLYISLNKPWWILIVLIMQLVNSSQFSVRTSENGLVLLLFVTIFFFFAA